MILLSLFDDYINSFEAIKYTLRLFSVVEVWSNQLMKTNIESFRSDYVITNEQGLTNLKKKKPQGQN